MNCVRINHIFFLALLWSMWPLAAAGQAALPYTRGEILHRDSLNDLSNWVVEQMPGGSVNGQSGKLEIDDAKGCTVWFRHKRVAPVIIEYEVTMIRAGGPNDNIETSIVSGWR